jgi:uncharacterized membrane protein
MPENRSLRASHFVLLGMVLCAAAFLRWYKIDNDALWTDEFFSLEVSAGHGYQHLDLSHDVLLSKPASLIEENSTGTWADLFLSLKRTNHPPLYFCILRIWRSIWHSDTDFTTRGLSALMSLIAIILAFDAVRTTSGTTAGFWSATLLAVAAPQIQFSQEARAYSMLIALMMGCAAAIARIERFGPNLKRFAALCLCAIGMLLTHYLAFALVAAMLIYVVIRFRAESRRLALLTLATATVVMVAGWGPFMLSQSHHFWGNLSWMYEPGEGSLPLVLTRVATLPLRFFAAPGRTFSLAISCVGAVLFILPLPLLRKYPELLLWSLILWIIVLVIAVGDLTRDSTGLLLLRYTLPAAAAANILVAILLSSMNSKWLRHAAPAALALAAAMTLPLSYSRNKPDWRPLAKYIDNTCKSDALFVLYPDVYGFPYDGVMDMGLSHYSRSWGKPILALDRPADEKVLNSLPTNVVIDVISGSMDPQQILPGCKVFCEIYYPEIGTLSRVEIPSAALASIAR